MASADTPHVSAARAALSRGEFTLAANQARAALASAGASRDARVLLGVAELGLGQLADGVATLGAVGLERRADEACRRGTLSMVLQGGHRAAAIAVLTRWIEALPRQAGDRDALQFQLASLHHQAGDVDAAIQAYRSLLRRTPTLAEAHNNLGTLLLERGDAAGALECFDRALARKRDYGRALNNRGKALLKLGRPADAQVPLSRAIELDPAYVEAITNLGVARLDAGDVAGAVRSHEQALQHRPGFVAAELNLANALLAAGEWRRAQALFEGVTRHAPRLVDGWAGAARAARAADDWAAALAHLREAVRLTPQDAELSRLLGACYCAVGEPHEALPVLRTALVQAPADRALRWQLAKALVDALDFKAGLDLFAALCAESDCPAGVRADHGRALARLAEERQIGRNHELAVEEFNAALALNPDDAPVHTALGAALERLNRTEEAAAHYARGLELDPGDTFAFTRGWDLRLNACDWATYEVDLARMIRFLDDGVAGIEPLYVTKMLDDPARQRTAARLLVGSSKLVSSGRSAPPPRAVVGPLRVAYLSGDFHDHPVGLSIVEVLERHDRSRVRVIGISLRESAGPMRDRLRGACDEFHEVAFPSHLVADTWLRGLNLDVAVDLMGHTAAARALYLSQHPARVQAAYLGFPGTMGAPWIDYLIADEQVIPSSAESCYDERIVRLPDSFFPSDSTAERPLSTDTRADHGLPEQGIVFCNFMSFQRLQPATYERWLRILARVPGSVLWLASGLAQAQANLQALAEARGIGGARVRFAPRVADRAHHLARHRHADLLLDGSPYNSHSTGRDALMVGLPMLTLAGAGFAARVATSLLSAVGLPELVTTSERDYEDLAVALALDRARLGGLRDRLNREGPASALFDMGGRVAALEAAYETMIEQHRHGRAPAAFAVDRTGARAQ